LISFFELGIDFLEEDAVGFISVTVVERYLGAVGAK
jgi:hypothetical protein